MGTPDSFNDGARRKLKVTAGPFSLKKVDRKATATVALARNPRWWGRPAKLDQIVLNAVPRDKRAAALAAGRLDLAEIDPADGRAHRARRATPSPAAPLAGPGAAAPPAQGRARSWAMANGSDEQRPADAEGRQADAGQQAARERRSALRGFVVRKSLEPAYTQLALNGADGPLADERVRRAVARALDRKELARLVLKPLGLPAVPRRQPPRARRPGSVRRQQRRARRPGHPRGQALLADAGWVPGGRVKKPKKKDGEKAAGAKGKKAGDELRRAAKPDADGIREGTTKRERSGPRRGRRDLVVGDDASRRRRTAREDHRTPGTARPASADEQAGRHPDGRQYAASRAVRPGAYAPKGTAAPAGAAASALAKDGKPLTLRFVLPSGAGLRSAARRRRPDRADAGPAIGIRTEITKVSDDSYFKDHIASGEYDLALYSWPASAFPATDARPDLRQAACPPPTAR